MLGILRGIPVILAVAGCAAGGKTQPMPSALAGADSLRITPVVDGVRHVYAWDARGPWGIHLLEIHADRCDPVVEARKAGPPAKTRARTSELAADALAGINADFFEIPAGTTVGAHVRDGEVIAGPGDRPILARTADGWWIGRAVLRGVVAHARAGRFLPVAQVNRAVVGGDEGVVVLTPWTGPNAARDSGAVAVAVRRIAEADAGGAGVVVRIDSLGLAAPPASGSITLLGRGRIGRQLGALAVGDTVGWGVRVVPAEGGERDFAATEAVGGFPILLRGGALAPELEAGVRPAFGEARHPRTAVGLDDDGRRVLWLVVDGRQEPYSAGMSLRELAELLRELGAERAINLDGGGSSALVIRGRVVNRPSDETGERPVGNALVLAGCRAGEPVP